MENKDISILKEYDGYVVDTSKVEINGYYKLVLEVGKRYRVCYGIHDGVYTYIGKVSESDKEHKFSHGQHLFKNKHGKICFGYYGASPYEFTSIVKPL